MIRTLFLIWWDNKRRSDAALRHTKLNRAWEPQLGSTQLPLPLQSHAIIFSILCFCCRCARFYFVFFFKAFWIVLTVLYSLYRHCPGSVIKSFLVGNCTYEYSSWRPLTHTSIFGLDRELSGLQRLDNLTHVVKWRYLEISLLNRYLSSWRKHQVIILGCSPWNKYRNPWQACKRKHVWPFLIFCCIFR